MKKSKGTSIRPFHQFVTVRFEWSYDTTTFVAVIHLFEGGRTEVIDERSSILYLSAVYCSFFPSVART